MGLFDRFKKKPTVMDKTRSLLSMDISDIWQLENHDDFITAMDGWVSRKPQGSLSAAERCFSDVMAITQDVAGDGFGSLYLDRGGEDMSGIPAALRELGFEKAADTASRALALLPDQEKQSERRYDLLDELERSEKAEALRALEREFNASLPSFAPQCRRYVESNRESFR